MDENRRFLKDERPNISIGEWKQSVVEIVKMRGNFWKSHGFSVDRHNYLYPEEALYLTEKKLVKIVEDDRDVEFKVFYEKVVQFISLPCYLAYLKLKTLDYIVFRYKKFISCFSNESDIIDFLLNNPESTLLDCMVSFAVYPQISNFSKKLAKEREPSGYVIITTSEKLFSTKLILTLLEEAKLVPIIFAIVLPTGNVFLEEITDANKSLSLTNDLAIPLAFNFHEDHIEHIENINMDNNHDNINNNEIEMNIE